MIEDTSRPWSVYILHCVDGSLYCGVAVDVEARLEAHRAGKGARYTRGRGPLSLVYQEVVGSRADAQRREYQIKNLPREEKLALIGVVRYPGTIDAD